MGRFLLFFGFLGKPPSFFGLAKRGHVVSDPRGGKKKKTKQKNTWSECEYVQDAVAPSLLAALDGTLPLIGNLKCSTRNTDLSRLQGEKEPLNL